MTAPLSDEALADLLAKAEAVATGPRCAVTVSDTTPGHADVMASYFTATKPATVAALVREVQRLRADRETLRASLVRLSPPDAIRNENNALRKNNERLTKENADLRERLKRAASANATAQTMATHWRLKATGEPMTPHEDEMNRYAYLSSDPARTDEEEAEMQTLGKHLHALGVDLGLPPVARKL